MSISGYMAGGPSELGASHVNRPQPGNTRSPSDINKALEEEALFPRLARSLEVINRRINDVANRLEAFNDRILGARPSEVSKTAGPAGNNLVEVMTSLSDDADVALRRLEREIERATLIA